MVNGLPHQIAEILSPSYRAKKHINQRLTTKQSFFFISTNKTIIQQNATTEERRIIYICQVEIKNHMQGQIAANYKSHTKSYLGRRGSVRRLSRSSSIDKS